MKEIGPRERQLREMREARAKKPNPFEDAARGRDTPQASGTARKAPSGSVLAEPSRNSVRASTHPVAKATKAKPSGLDAKGPSKTPVTPADRVASRLGAGRTAQDSPQSEMAGAVAIQRRGRPRNPDASSRATKYRRQKEQKAK